MQKRIAVINMSKGYVISLLMAVVGLVLVLCGVKNYFLIQQRISLSELTLEQCREGQYISGEITQYAGNVVGDLWDGHFYGESTRFLAGLKEYGIYTVKLSGDEYISVLIANKDLLKKLEAYEMGYGNGAYLEGKIEKCSIGLNYQWLQKAFGTESIEEIEQIVSPVYEIREVSFRQETLLFTYGIAISVIAALIFVASGGLKGFISYEAVMDNDNNKFQMMSENTYNLENELEIIKRYLEKLEKQKVLMQKKVLYRIPLLLLGFVIIVQNYWWEVKIMGIVCLIVFFNAVWRLFIHSDCWLARYIVGILGMDSLQKKMTECRWEIERYQKNKFKM